MCETGVSSIYSGYIPVCVSKPFSEQFLEKKKKKMKVSEELYTESVELLSFSPEKNTVGFSADFLSNRWPFVAAAWDELLCYDITAEPVRFVYYQSGVPAG